MALKDQPYLPLYIQDVLTDERLVECSAESHGVYFLLLCILHKQEKYGLLCLKQKYKQNAEQIVNFASMLARQMPFEQNIIQKSLTELIGEGVLTLDTDNLFQKRMVRDGELSLTRTKIGKLGGSSVTKQYGKPGFLYLMSDGFTLHKIGISVNPKNRLYRLRSDLTLPKHFLIIEQLPVEDMGACEDLAFDFFADKMDGEWVKDTNENVLKKFALLKANILPKEQAKVKANPVIEITNENENDIVIDNSIIKIEKTEISKIETFVQNLRESGKMLEAIQKQNKISAGDATTLREHFITQHEAAGTNSPNQTDFNNHCLSWCRMHKDRLLKTGEKKSTLSQNTETLIKSYEAVRGK